MIGTGYAVQGSDGRWLRRGYMTAAEPWTRDEGKRATFAGRDTADRVAVSRGAVVVPVEVEIAGDWLAAGRRTGT